jgi:hypothetical protein
LETKTLTQHALKVADAYENFSYGPASCNIPYFNNKVFRNRGALRTYSGKGSIEDISDELSTILIKNKIDKKDLSGDVLKKLLVENNIGIDCSGFAYYVLDAENRGLGRPPLRKIISFVNCSGFLGKFLCTIRPAANCDVETLAHDNNTHVVPVTDVKPGDIITMLTKNNIDKIRNHIVVITAVEYKTSIISKIFYSHAVAYPEDGLYGNGVRHGEIEIVSPEKSIIDQEWTENGRKGNSNRLFVREQEAETELRRLN